MVISDEAPITSPKRQSLVKRGRRIAVIIALLYITVMVSCRPADRLLLIPQPSAERVLDATSFSLPFEGGSLEVFTARSPGAPRAGEGEPDAYMLEFTGNGSRADDITGWVASRWGERSVETWVMNYPGYGRSTGPARLATLGPAGLHVFDELTKRANGKPIYVAGNSMGTTVALHVAANRPSVAGLILQSPAALRQIILNDHGWWNLWLLAYPVALGVPNDLDSLQNAANVKAPAIIITADNDTLIRPVMQRLVTSVLGGPKRTITLINKGHNDSLETRSEMEEFNAALDWMTATTKNVR